MDGRNVFSVNYEQRLVAVSDALSAAERDRHWERAESLRLAQALLQAVVADRRRLTAVSA